MLRSDPHQPPPPPGDPLEFLRSVAAALEQIDCVRALEAAQRTRSRGLLRVAVLGQFKQGKSTLLNALVGRDLLPSGVLPLTTVPTEVRDGPDALEVELAGGAAAPHRLEELAEFVTEAGNPDNARGVRRVEVRVPLPAWARDVVFIDSPGIGSVHDQATGASHRLLSEVDAGVLVLSPDPPVSRIELDFVREAAEFASKLFVVINKADLLSREDRSKLVEYTARVLRDRAGLDVPRIYTLSAREVLRADPAPRSSASDAAGWAALVADLARYLGRDRRASVRRVEERQVALYAKRLRGIAALNLKSLAMSDREFEHADTEVRTLIGRLPDEHRAADALLDGEMTTLLAAVDRRLATFREEQQPPIVGALEAFLKSARATGASALVREFDRRFREVLTPRIAELRGELERYVTAELEVAFRRYERRITALLESIDRAAASSFDVDLVPVAADGSLPSSAAYYPRVAGLLEDSFAGQTALFLPALLVRGRIRRGLGRTVAEELDAQSGRLKTDLVDRILAATRQFKEAATGRIAQDAQSVENAVRMGRAQRAGSGQEVAVWRARVEDWVRRMDALLSDPAQAPDARVPTSGGRG